jgi:sugar O-acyltransferase (sialic acid O-acetyltransferase NeuD family)
MSVGTPLLVVGAGGFARETAEAVHAVNAFAPAPRWSLLGFLDDDPDKHGRLIGGVPVLGPVDLVCDHRDAQVVLATGRPADYTSRLRLTERLRLVDERYATIIHPSATVGRSSDVGAGSVLLAHADLTADVVVGRHVAIMPQVVLPHDVRIGDFATLASGVRVGGACAVGEGVYVGAGAILRERLRIGPWAMIGMGSTVTRDVPAERMWFGSPARDSGRAPLPLTQVRAR